jgi:hypothetical protein
MLAYVLFGTQRYDECIWPSAGEDQTDRAASPRGASRLFKIARCSTDMVETSSRQRTSSDQSEQIARMFGGIASMRVLTKLRQPDRQESRQRPSPVRGLPPGQPEHRATISAEPVVGPALDQFLDRAGDIFDGDGGINAVLVQEIDRVGAQTRERGVDHLSNVIGTAVNADDGASGRIELNPNFVAMTTRSRSGASASPTSVSFVSGP